MLEVRLYRWKEDKDVYLTREYFPSREMKHGDGYVFDTTKDLRDALWQTSSSDFAESMRDLKGVKHTQYLYFTNEEGYKGTLEKNIFIPISDFELVVLREVIN